MAMRDSMRQGIYLQRESIRNILLSVHGAGGSANNIEPFGNFWAAIQELERQYAEHNPKERTDWSTVAMEVRSQPGQSW